MENFFKHGEIGGKRKTMLECLKSDLYRYEGKTTWKSFIKYYRKNAGFRFLVAYRLVNEKGILKIMGGILWTFRDKQRIQILRETKIGCGLYISHGGPVVVNPSAVIGNNCNLSQFVTIGSNEGRAAVIGDNVYIGPGAKLFGKIEIGNNVSIGANAVVTKSFPMSNVTIAGVPAKVIKNYNANERVMRMNRD